MEIDLEKGTVRDVATGVIYQGEAPGDFVMSLYKEGGIKPLMRKKAWRNWKMEDD